MSELPIFGKVSEANKYLCIIDKDGVNYMFNSDEIQFIEVHQIIYSGIITKSIVINRLNHSDLFDKPKKEIL
jgi:hypothetical protein